MDIVTHNFANNRFYGIIADCSRYWKTCSIHTFGHIFSRKIDNRRAFIPMLFNSSISFKEVIDRLVLYAAERVHNHIYTKNFDFLKNLNYLHM